MYILVSLTHTEEGETSSQCCRSGFGSGFGSGSGRIRTILLNLDHQLEAYGKVDEVYFSTAIFNKLSKY
jgi:hypothetical protein